MKSWSEADAHEEAWRLVVESEYRKARRRRGWEQADAEEYGRRLGFGMGYRAEPLVPAADAFPGVQAGYSEGREAWKANHR